jgi:hypothetical protein
MYFQTKDPIQAEELRAETCEQCKSMSLGVCSHTLFDRNAGLSNRHFILELGIMLTVDFTSRLKALTRAYQRLVLKQHPTCLENII